MFFNVVCYCGAPIGGLYRYYVIAKLLTFQDQSDNLEAAVKKIQAEFSQELYEFIFEFLFVSFDHLNVYQALDKKKAIKDLLK